jgi:uncharacterized protein (TIGR02246 family)
MSSESDRSAIYEHRDAYNQTLRDGDVEGWLATLSDDCVFLPPASPAANGKDAVRKWATETIFDPFHVGLDYDFEELEFVGSWAFGWGWFQQTLTPKAGGDVVQVRGTFLDVFRQEADGKWLLARVSFNTDHE